MSTPFKLICTKFSNVITNNIYYYIMIIVYSRNIINTLLFIMPQTTDVYNLRI